jgi:small basic protein (TIGR04137 family)
MSMDKGLKSGGALTRHRNVLTRDERIQALKEVEKWQDGSSVLGLPKVAHRKVATKKGKPAEKAKEAVAAEGEAATPVAEEAAKGGKESAKPGKEAAKPGAKAGKEAAKPSAKGPAKS